MSRTIVHLVVVLCVVGSVRADQTIPNQTVQSVQQALKDQGFYYGNVTGDMGTDTTAAIRRYQIRNGLQVTGEINPETLGSLNLSSDSAASSQPSSKPAITPPKSVGSGDSSRVQRSWSPRSFGESDGRVEMNRSFAAPSYRWVPSRINGRIVAEVQHQLANRGYYRSRIDGRYGRRTAFAVRAFQWRSGISPTGRLDVTTLNALGLSDWNIAYLESAPQSYENWAPVKKFEPGKWREKWEKHYRDEDSDEYDDDDLYGIWEQADKELEYGQREEEWGKKREEEWKKREEELKKWKEKWKKHYRKDHEHGEEDGKGHGHKHDD